MKLNTSRERGVLIIDVAGRIDGNNARAFDASLEGVISADDRSVLVDCKDLSYISSAGLRSILIVAKALWARDGKFALCALSSPIADIMTTVGFEKIIPIHASRADMLASLDR